MAEVEHFPPHVDLQALLDEQGIAAPENTVARSAEWGIDVAVTRLYGVEVTSSAGVIGRLVVRQVEQLPDEYTVGLPSGHSRMEDFQERHMTGVFADMRVRSVSPAHLLVARKAILVMQNASATNQMTMHARKGFAMGRKVDTGRLLEFDTTGAAVTRPLELVEMDHTEPSSATMLFAALKRR